MLTTTEEFDDRALTALIAAATLLGADLKAGLNTADINPTKVLTVGDMVEPTYAAYARQVVVMGTPYRDPTYGIVALADALVWQEPGVITSVTIRGIFYTSGADNHLVGYEKIDPPVNLVDALSAFRSILQWIQSSPYPGLTTIIR